MTTEFAAKILSVLTKEHFHQWYIGDFENYVVAEEDCKTEKEILEDVKKLFNSIDS